MTDDAKPFHNPFAILNRLGGSGLGEPDEPKSARVPRSDGSKRPVAPSDAVTERGSATREDTRATKGTSRAVVRMERSGRGGKEVTVIEQLPLNGAEREVWLKALKAALGCGGSIEGDTLMLQGDQRKRLPDLLSRRGVKRITVA